MREEGCVQNCNTAACQRSFVSYLCKYYFRILLLGCLRISLLSLTLFTSLRGQVLNELCLEEADESKMVVCLFDDSAPLTLKEKCVLEACLLVTFIQ